jgi:hypothetical protein
VPTPGARSVFRPTVLALGLPVPSMKWTALGSPQLPGAPSGFVNPVAQEELMMADMKNLESK